MIVSFQRLARVARAMEKANTHRYLRYAKGDGVLPNEPQKQSVIDKRMAFMNRGLRLADVAKALEVLADSPDELSEIAELIK